MILVADSGSSKTSWAVHSGDIQYVESAGMNPYFNSETEIINLIARTFPAEIIRSCKEIYFYGAGCNAETNRQKLHSVFQNVFSKAQKVEVSDDLTAALRATCGNEKGIACILGTGSGSVYGNEGKVIAAKLGNGIWLGDEGSGGHLGKLLIKAFLNNELPKGIKMKLEDAYALDRTSILEQVYRGEKPNAYLAAFAPFILKNEANEFMNTLIRSSFQQFFEKNIHIYPNYKTLQVHFVGSIAFRFKKYLEMLAQTNAFSLKNVIPRPIEKLMEYHAFH